MLEVNINFAKSIWIKKWLHREWKGFLKIKILIFVIFLDTFAH